MRCALVLFIASFLMETACQRAADDGPVAEAAVDDAAAEVAGGAKLSDFIVGAPIRHANLTVFPISSVTAKTQDRFLTLDEGLKAGLVEITELAAAEPNATETTSPAQPNNRQPEPTDPFGDEAKHDASTPSRRPQPIEDLFDQPAQGNQVNRLAVVNQSDRPLYLMPGEIIVGGQQDRVIGQELVIEPGPKPVPIDVFCVEQGRWAKRDEAMTRELLETAASSEQLAKSVAGYGGLGTADLARHSNTGKFVASVGNLSKAARQAVQQAATNDDSSALQGEVWRKVDRENARRGVRSDSTAYTVNYASRESVQALDAYLAQLERPIAETKQVVGAIVAINGKAETLDLFESTPLFHKLWPKLLKSYALDAVNAARDENSGEACSRDAARQFLADTLTSTERDASVKGNVALSRRESDRVEAFSAHERKTADGQLGGVGNFGGAAVHSSGFSK